MGKGDLKTRKGKIFIGSYGKSRPRKRRKYSTITKDLADRHVDLAWFKPKSYIHFGKQLKRRDKHWVYKFVSNTTKVASYHFYPLIYRKLSQRKYKKFVENVEKFYRSHYDKVKKESTEKERHIFFATHLDSMIYSYYAKSILAPKYEAILQEDSELAKAICAYRKVKIKKNTVKGKSNIHFAKDVFEEVKKRKNCVALAFDITKFFDNLNHNYLKSVWAKLMGNDNGYLDDDHFNIYKSLTQFSFVEENDLLNETDLIQIQNKKKQRKRLQKIGCYCKGKTNKKRNKDFRERICGGGLLKPHTEYEKKLLKEWAKVFLKVFPLVLF